MQRPLSLNQPVSVIVDGRESNVLPPRLERIEPAQAAYPGKSVKLVGRSLSGQNVIVMFNNTAITSGPHAYGSEITVTEKTIRPYADNREYVSSELAYLDFRLHCEVLRLRKSLPEKFNNEFKGIYISEQEIDTILSKNQKGQQCKCQSKIDPPGLHF